MKSNIPILFLIIYFGDPNIVSSAEYDSNKTAPDEQEGLLTEKKPHTRLATEGTIMNRRSPRLYDDFLTLGSRNYLGKFVTPTDYSVFDNIVDDIISFQEVRIQSEMWYVPELGSLQTFRPTTNLFGGLFYASAAAWVVHNESMFLHSFGLYVNPNLNFTIEDVSSVTDDSHETKGLVILKGTIDDRRVAVCGMHGIWDADNGGYNDERNKNLIRRAVESIDPSYAIIIIGDTNLSWNPALNLSQELNLTIEDGPKVTCFDADGNANPDHIMLRDVEFIRQPRYVYTSISDHLWLTGCKVNLQRTVQVNDDIETIG